MITLIWILSIPLAIVAGLFAIGYIAAIWDLEDLPKATAAVRPRVLLLGYHPSMAGGVTAVTRPLLAGMPEVSLLPVKHGYGAKAWVLYGVSMLRLVWAIVRIRGPLVAHLIVASRGDRVRGVLPILLCKAFRVPILAHYHTNSLNMMLNPEVQ